MTAIGPVQRAWRPAQLYACVAFVLLLAGSASAQFVQLEPGPELQPRRLPRIYLQLDASADDFPPTVFVSQSLEQDAAVVAPPEQAIIEGVPPPVAAPHAHPRAGCGC